MGESALLETAIVAGGCFWCLQGPFEALPGVMRVTVGYTGGSKADPVYEEVGRGTTGHYEAVKIEFDPEQTSYARILDVFWRQIDPTDPGGQFADRGSQYRTAIFYLNDTQKREAENSRESLARSGRFSKPIATEVKAASAFYPAEKHHQGYYRACPAKYERYHRLSGREDFIGRYWAPGAKAGSERQSRAGGKYAKPSAAELKARLNPLQYDVTQACGTEPPFRNAYWNNYREGIYVDVATGEPLFGSRDKFDSDTGWPSFSRPLEEESVVEREDLSHGRRRIEVRSRCGDSHLGHVFADGPEPTGLRYCVNSAALRFIPKKDLVKEGYGEYQILFTSGGRSERP